RAIVPPGAAIRQMRYQISPVIGRDAIVIRTSPRSLSDDHDVTDYAESSLHEGNPMPLTRIFHTDARNEVGGIVTAHVESVVETDHRGDSADAKLYRDPSAVCEARTTSY